MQERSTIPEPLKLLLADDKSSPEALPSAASLLYKTCEVYLKQEGNAEIKAKNAKDLSNALEAIAEYKTNLKQNIHINETDKELLLNIRYDQLNALLQEKNSDLKDFINLMKELQNNCLSPVNYALLTQACGLNFERFLKENPRSTHTQILSSIELQNTIDMLVPGELQKNFTLRMSPEQMPELSKAIRALAAFQNALENFSDKNSEIYKNRQLLVKNRYEQLNKLLNANTVDLSKFSELLILSQNTVRELAELNAALQSKPESNNVNTAGGEVYKSGAALLAELLSNRKTNNEDMGLLKTSVADAKAAVKFPDTQSAATTAGEKVFANANKAISHKQTSGWSKFAGAMMMLGGAVLVGVSLVNIPQSGGASIGGVFLGGLLMAAGGLMMKGKSPASIGATLFMEGSQGLLSKAWHALTDNKQERSEPSRTNRSGPS